jgi:hypothetical protein
VTPFLSGQERNAPFDQDVVIRALGDFHDRLTTLETKETGGVSGVIAPHDAEFVVVSLDATLTNERVLAVTAPLVLTDAGAGSTITIELPAGVQYQHLEHTGAAWGVVTHLNQADDAFLYFGNDQDVAMEYDEDDTDQFRVTGADWVFAPNLIMDDGVGDSPQLRFVGQTDEQATLHFDNANSTLVTTIEDNQAVGYSILDDGDGDLYMQIVTTTGSEEVVFNNGGDDVNFRVQSVSYTNMLFVDAGFESVLINSATDLSSTFGVVATALGDIGIVVRGVASQAANLQEWQSNVPATLLSVEPDGDLNFSSGIGIIHADGVTAGMVLVADDTRYVPAAAVSTLPLPPVAEGDMIIADATPEWAILSTAAGAGYALVSNLTTQAWNQTPAWTGEHVFGAGLEVSDDQALTLGTNDDATIRYDEAGDDRVEATGADWHWTIDQMTILSSVSSRPVFTLENTNTDNQEPIIDFYKNSSSPADDDNLGAIDFYGKTFVGTKERYVSVLAESLDVTNGDTGGGIRFTVVMDAVERNLLDIRGYNGTVNQGEVIINQDSQDVDFRVESNVDADALEVRGSDSQVTLGVLGAGFVQSTAGGVLSSAAIVVGDLPAHAAEHEVGGGDLVDHDALTNFVANEHIDHTSVTLTAGTGLTGGGDISANRTFNVGAGDGITANANDVALTTPGTLTAATGNSAAGNHTHAITDTSDGAANHSTILSSNASGQLTLDDLFVTTGGFVGISGADGWTFDSAGGDITTTSKVGIGIAAPATILHVFGTGSSTLQRDIATASVTLSLRNDNTTAGNGAFISFQTPDTSADLDNAARIGCVFSARSATGVTGELAFETADDADNPTERMRIDETGKVGIGTPTPATLLDVSGTGDVVTFGDGSSSAGVIIDGAAATVRTLKYRTGGTDRWLVRTSSDAEAGANAGSNFQFAARSDAGAGIGNALVLDRATLYISIPDRMYHVGDPDTYWNFNAADQAQIVCGNAVMAQFVETTLNYVEFFPSVSGIVYVNRVTDNSKMTLGLTVDQSTNDDEALALQSSTDVDHGITDFADTETFVSWQKLAAGTGGVITYGLTEDIVGYSVRGLVTTAQTGKTSSDSACVSIHGHIKDDTGIGNATADMNLLAVRTTRGGSIESVVIIDEDGDIYYDGSLNALLDDEVDGLACWDLSHGLAGAWNRAISYNRDKLEEMGVIRVGDDGGIMVSNKRVTALSLGAHGQSYLDRMDLRQQLNDLRTTVAAYQERIVRLEAQLGAQA